MTHLTHRWRKRRWRSPTDVFFPTAAARRLRLRTRITSPPPPSALRFETCRNRAGRLGARRWPTRPGRARGSSVACRDGGGGGGGGRRGRADAGGRLDGAERGVEWAACARSRSARGWAGVRRGWQLVIAFALGSQKTRRRERRARWRAPRRRRARFLGGALEARDADELRPAARVPARRRRARRRAEAARPCGRASCASRGRAARAPLGGKRSAERLVFGKRGGGAPRDQADVFFRRRPAAVLHEQGYARRAGGTADLAAAANGAAGTHITRKALSPPPPPSARALHERQMSWSVVTHPRATRRSAAASISTYSSTAFTATAVSAGCANQLCPPSPDKASARAHVFVQRGPAPPSASFETSARARARGARVHRPGGHQLRAGATCSGTPSTCGDPAGGARARAGLGRSRLGEAAHGLASGPHSRDARRFRTRSSIIGDLGLD